MTFAEIIPKLKIDTRIRCSWWDKGVYIAFDTFNYDILSWFNPRPDGFSRVEVYEFTDEDFHHDGWEVLE